VREKKKEKVAFLVLVGTDKNCAFVFRVRPSWFVNPDIT